jgi:hypothetical protein
LRRHLVPSAVALVSGQPDDTHHRESRTLAARRTTTSKATGVRRWTKR